MRGNTHRRRHRRLRLPEGDDLHAQTPQLNGMRMIRRRRPPKEHVSRSSKKGTVSR